MMAGKLCTVMMAEKLCTVKGKKARVLLSLSRFALLSHFPHDIVTSMASGRVNSSMLYATDVLAHGSPCKVTFLVLLFHVTICDYRLGCIKRQWCEG